MKSLLENLPKLLVVLTLGASAASLFHELGFYSTLGLQLHEVPFGAIDQFKNWLTLIPALAAVLIFLQPFTISILDTNSKGAATEKEHDKGTIFSGAKFVTIVLATFGVIAFGLAAYFKESLIPGISLIWSAFGFYLLLNKEQTALKGTTLYLVVFAPVIGLGLYYAGEQSSSKRLRDAPTAKVEINSKSGLPIILSGKILRTYENFVLIANSNTEYTIISIKDITSIKINTDSKSEIKRD